jgi:hypothetical protein
MTSQPVPWPVGSSVSSLSACSLGSPTKPLPPHPASSQGENIMPPCERRCTLVRPLRCLSAMLPPSLKCRRSASPSVRGLPTACGRAGIVWTVDSSVGRCGIICSRRGLTLRRGYPTFSRCRMPAFLPLRTIVVA